jgi:hypothetical protein
MTTFPKIWPERWLEDMRRQATPTAEYRDAATGRTLAKLPAMYPGTDGKGLWVGVERLVREGHGRISLNYDEFRHTQYASEVRQLGEQMEQSQRMEVANGGAMWASQHLIGTYLVARWLYHGRRYYAVDPATALALLDTEFDEYPVADVRLPVQTFWVGIPPTIQWFIDSSKIDSPNAQKEPTQRVEGLLVGGCDFDADGKPNSLRMLICGKSAYPEEDAHLWYSTGLNTATGTLEPFSQLRPPMEMDESNRAYFAGADFAGEQEMMAVALKFVLGLCLYLNCVHPQLKVHEPVPLPTVRRKGRHKQTWNQYEQSTRCHVTYVGGPDHAHRQAALVEGAPMAEMTRRPPRPHTRAGHIRRQWVGTGELRHVENRWIQPVKVGDWSRILLWDQTQHVIHKTRRAEVVAPDEVLRFGASMD